MLKTSLPYLIKSALVAPADPCYVEVSDQALQDGAMSLPEAGVLPLEESPQISSRNETFGPIISCIEYMRSFGTPMLKLGGAREGSKSGSSGGPAILAKAEL